MGASDQGVIGASVRRKEDQRFLTGAGQFTDDVNPANHVHAFFLRSPHAHAKIREELEGNLCRCTGYQNIVRAVKQGAAAMTK